MKARVLFLLWLIPFGFAAGWAAAPDQARDLAEEGNRDYTASKFEDAYQSYHRCVAAGLANADLFFNLGNAAYRTRRLGEAVLWYRRTLWMDPAHVDARFNLEFIRRQRLDQVPPVTLTPLDRFLEWVNSHVGSNALGWGLLFLSGESCALTLVFLSVRFGRRRRVLTLLLTLSWMFTLIAGGAFAVLIAWQTGKSEGVVLEKSVDVRSGPSVENPVLFTVHEGLELEIAAETPAWRQVVLPSGWNGWAPAPAIGRVDEQ